MNNEVLLSNIRDLCKKNNITVTYLEKLMGMGAGTISRWNKASPSFDKIMSIAEYFKISIDKLAGYTVAEDSVSVPDEKTSKIIDYLLQMTTKNETGYSFWQDYKKNKQIELLVSDLPSMEPDKSDMSRLFYAGDETGFFLLEAVYILNNQYDYETEIRLYLVPDELTLPVLESSCKSALQDLYIAVVRRLEFMENRKEAQKKAQTQREKILEKYSVQD